MLRQVTKNQSKDARFDFEIELHMLLQEPAYTVAVVSLNGLSVTDCLMKP